MVITNEGIFIYNKRKSPIQSEEYFSYTGVSIFFFINGFWYDSTCVFYDFNIIYED